MFCNACTGFPAKLHMRNVTSAAIPYPGPGSATDWMNLVLANQKHYQDLGSIVSSVWNCCTHFSVVLSQGNQWWFHKISAVFSG